MELSVNFIVKLIIALVVFGFGLVLVRNIMSTAGSGELTRDIDEQMESQIQMLMDSGDRIVIFPEERTVSIGETATFALGILNVLGRPGSTDFDIEVECHQFVDSSGGSSDCGDYADDDWTFDDYPTLDVENNAEGKTGISVRPNSDARLGTYIYNVLITYDGESEDYGISKFRVNVEN